MRFGARLFDLLVISRGPVEVLLWKKFEATSRLSKSPKFSALHPAPKGAGFSALRIKGQYLERGVELCLGHDGDGELLGLVSFGAG